MTFTYDVTTALGKVRLWIQDTDANAYAFSDEEINAVMSDHSDDVRQSSASLLLILANSKAKLAKMKSAGKYSEDTRSIAKELRDQAKAILDMAVEPWFDVAEQTFGPMANPLEGSQEREFIEREDLRGT